MSSFRVRRAARVLRQAGVVAYPTEAVYGLGCDPLDGAAVGRLLRLKQRRVDKGLILIADRFSRLEQFIERVDADTERRALRVWPGPITWLWPASAECPGWITGGRETIAVRVTAHPIAAALCRSFGAALVSTSANASARRPARNPLEVRRRLAGEPDYVLAGPLGSGNRPTTIVDLISGTVVRPG